MVTRRVNYSSSLRRYWLTCILEYYPHHLFIAPIYEEVESILDITKYHNFNCNFEKNDRKSDTRVISQSDCKTFSLNSKIMFKSKRTPIYKKAFLGLNDENVNYHRYSSQMDR